MICACGCGKEFSLTNNRRRYYSDQCQARDWYRRCRRTPEYRRAHNLKAGRERERLRRIFLAALPAVRCKQCRKAFKRSRIDEVYCSVKCRKKAGNDRRKRR